MNIKFFYQSGAMGLYGEGYLWHKFFNLPKFDYVSKTITLEKKIGLPYAVLPMPWSKFTWNKVSLHNPGFLKWRKNWFYDPARTVSIAGTDDEIEYMVHNLDGMCSGIELNFSCPNVNDKSNKKIPTSKHPMYLKLRWNQDPNDYDLSKIKGIRLNTIPKYHGGVGGKPAQKYNWKFIRKYCHLQEQGISIAGTSWLNLDDIKYLHEIYGITEFGIGSVILLNPRFVETLSSHLSTSDKLP